MASKKKTAVTEAKRGLSVSGKPAGPGWTWTEQKEAVLALVLQGVSKRQIAGIVGVHRNTVNAWTAQPEFVIAARRQFQEHVSTTRVRRLMETNHMTTRIAKLMSSALALVEKENSKPADFRKAIEMMREYRQWREQERQDMGDNVQRVQVQGGLILAGEENVQHGTHKTSFRDYLNSVIDESVIDVEAIAEGDAEQTLTAVVQQALTEGTLLDVIDEEDRLLKAEEED